MTPREQLHLCQALAIALNEGPDGPNRQRAQALQRQLQPPRPQPRGNNTAAFLAGALGSLLMLFGGLSVCIQLVQQGRLDQLITAADRIQRALQQQNAASAPPAPSAVPANPTPAPHEIPLPPRQPALPDPAGAMQARFHAATWGDTYAGLDAGIDQYRKLSGTLARMQAVGLRNRSAALRLPIVLLNRTNDCFDGHSIGVYSPRCETIKINYGDGHLIYEHPVEIEVVLAHEWGHHLINLSGKRMSPTEAEVVSDCMAGVVFGYYAKHQLITRQEALQAFEMVAAVGNNSAHGHHPNQEVLIKAFAGGLMSIALRHDPKAQEAIAFCSTLEQVLDLDKVREMGVTWPT